MFNVFHACLNLNLISISFVTCEPTGVLLFCTCTMCKSFETSGDKIRASVACIKILW